MLQMTEFIFSQITEKIDPSSSKQVIRVDGLDDLRIYQHLCKKLDVYCHHHDMDLIAKLSRRKFEQFKGRYAYEAEQLTLKHWVDFDDHMTSYRNLVPQPGRKLLIVLMGTDMVTDKGGLSDFYAITPHTIDQKVGKNYASLMGSELRTQLDMDKIAPIVNTFFDSLFSCVPQDLSRVSEIMDGWRTSLPSPDEVTENLYAGLPQWQIPMIRDAVPSSIGKKTDKANGILASGYKFISGKTYSKITKATITSVEKKFDSYQEKEKRYAAFYPEGQALSSLGDLRDAVLSFLSGNRTDELRRKLLYTDYSIIEDVLKTKLPSPRHEKQKTVVGSPLQALSQALLSMAGKATFPVDTFHLSFETASMAGVSSKQDKDMKDDENDEHVHSLLEAWSRITCFAGGIIDFLTDDGHLFGCDEFQLVFEPVDFFAPSKAYDLYESGILKPCTGVNHKIEFHIDALLEGDVIETQSFIWQIRPSDDWLNAFGELFDFPKDCKAYLPFPKVDEINTAFTLKDEESFTYWFDHTKKSYADILSSRLHEGSLEKQEEANQFALLGKSFMIWRDAVVNKGFFSTLSAETRDLVSAYTKLAEHIAHTPIYTGNAYDLCRLFMNAFTIRACGPDTIGTDEGDQYIVPPYHPAALEKIAERMRFIRQGLSEWLASALTPDEKCEPLQDRMDQLLSLSTLHNATDAFFLDAAHLQPCTSSYGYYTLYGFPKQQQEFVSAIDIQRAESVFEDDFEDAEMKRLTQEARFLLSVLKRYTATYPQAREALSVTFINPDNLQTVVSSLYQYFVDLRKELSQDTPILMRLHVIMRNEIHGARAYLSYWINHVFTSDDNLDMKVYLNVYEKDQDIPALVPDVTDLVFFFDALNTERCATYNFNVMQETPVVTNHHCRYPLVFRPMFTGSHEFDHTIAITQPQFSAATAHTQVLRLYRDKHVYDERYGLIQVSALDRHLDSVIMNIQEKTTWLTCIDPAIDKHSVLNMYARDTGIIGFTTGEGSFGQMNAVMTCKRSIAEDIHQRFALRLHYMFPKWTDEQIKNASSFCMEKAKQMNGVSVLRAMNPSDYEMNNFMAYLIADELTRHTDATLNVLIHMDSYRHWLQGRTYDEGAHVPDFLHIQASLEPGRPLHLVATVIESKIAKNDDLLSTHLDKAREQVLDGLSVLRRHFDPNDTSVEHRYWLSQLYRAILFLLGDLNLDDQQACDLSANRCAD